MHRQFTSAVLMMSEKVCSSEKGAFKNFALRRRIHTLRLVAKEDGLGLHAF